jgi:high-affinity iron transporter
MTLLDKRVDIRFSRLLSISFLIFITVGVLFGFQNSYAQIINDTQNDSQLNLELTDQNSTNNTNTNTMIVSETTENSEEPTTPIQFISKIRTLLNQTIEEYNNQNFTGAEELAISAYLDNYEYVEAPLAEKDRPLMETTEIMMREELRQMILDEVPNEEIVSHIEDINNNLDRAVELLSDSSSATS